MKNTFVKAKKPKLNYTMRSMILHKISCIYSAHILENELFPTMAVQQSQHVDAVGCHTFSGLIRMLHFANCLWVHLELQWVH